MFLQDLMKTLHHHCWLQAASFSYEQHGVLIISCAIALLGVLCFAWGVFMFKKSAINGLPPGPRPLPLVGNLLSLDPELHKYFKTLSQTHGPIFSLWLGRKIGIIITSPAIARQVLKDQDTIFANRDVPALGRIALYGGRDILWSPYGPEWRMLRKVCVQEMLSNSTLESVHDLRRREFRQTIKFFYEQGRAGRAVNIGEQMFLTMFNLITGMMWGGTVEGKERENLGLEFRKIVTEMEELLNVPNVSDFYPGLAKFDLQGLQGKMKRVANRMDNIFDTIIDKRLRMEEKKEESRRKDFLQVLLQLKDDQKTPPFTITHLKSLFMDMIIAGTDTTSNTVEFAMAEIMNKPEILRKLQEEVDGVVGKDNIVEESHINELPYLYAVMKETLRLHPVAPLLVPRRPSQTCIVGGYTIPEGAHIVVNVWAIQRDPEVWENPLEFRPERFLDCKWNFNGNSFEFLPFGSGRRICVGIASAERMFMVALASMLHSFDWKLPQGECLDISDKFGLVLTKRIPLAIIPTPRLSHPTQYE